MTTIAVKGRNGAVVWELNVEKEGHLGLKVGGECRYRM